MTAQRLRDAAQKIRDTANATMQGEDEWFTVRPGATTTVWDHFADVYDEDAPHIALWSPPVALAVADWLAVTAYDIDNGVQTPGSAAALAVVELILGTQP